jgi:hypothetical protein
VVTRFSAISVGELTPSLRARVQLAAGLTLPKEAADPAPERPLTPRNEIERLQQLGSTPEAAAAVAFPAQGGVYEVLCAQRAEHGLP